MINKQKEYSQINQMVYNNQTFLSDFNEESDISSNDLCWKYEKGKPKKLAHLCSQPVKIQ